MRVITWNQSFKGLPNFDEWETEWGGISEKLNGAESAKGEAGEKEEWRYGPVRSAAVACGRRWFRLTSSC